MTDVREEETRLLLEVTTSRSRRVKDRLSTVWMVISLVIVVIPLAFVVGYVVVKGLGVIDAAWFTEDIQARSREAGGGMSAAIVGTLLITAGATAMAVPLGVLGAIYLHEYGGSGRLAGLIRFMSDVMTGVPSIVMGLFIYTVWTLRFGISGFGGSLALACLMLPIVIRSTEEMLRLVPRSMREASIALGTTRRIVCAAATRWAIGNRAPSSAWFFRPPSLGSSAGSCWPSRGPRARRHRCCSRSVGPGPSTRTSSKGPTARCHSRSSATPSSRSRPRRTGRGGPRSRWSRSCSCSPSSPGSSPDAYR
jgi:ABC-type amino acid transport system permease subunit